MADEVICGFMNKAIYDEIIPTLTLPKDELESFAFSVTERFKNPFIDHALLSISLNSTSKWRARVLPTVKDYITKTGNLPKCLLTSFALYVAFYHNGKELTEAGLSATRSNGDSYTVSDDRTVLEFYLNHKEDSLQDLAYAVCSNCDFWGEDLTELDGFTEMVADVLNEIDKKGTYAVMKECL